MKQDYIYKNMKQDCMKGIIMKLTGLLEVISTYNMCA